MTELVIEIWRAALPISHYVSRIRHQLHHRHIVPGLTGQNRKGQDGIHGLFSLSITITLLRPQWVIQVLYVDELHLWFGSVAFENTWAPRPSARGQQRSVKRCDQRRVKKRPYFWILDVTVWARGCQPPLNFFLTELTSRDWAGGEGGFWQFCYRYLVQKSFVFDCLDTWLVFRKKYALFTFSSHTEYVKRESIVIAWVEKKVLSFWQMFMIYMS